MRRLITLILLCCSCRVATPVLGADWFGRLDETGSTGDDIENYIKGGAYFCNGDGTADSINVYLEVQYDAAPVRCALYQRSGMNWVLIDSSAEQNCPVDTTWYSFPMTERAPVVDGQQYALLVWADQSPNWNCRLRDIQSVGNPADSIFYLSGVYGDWPSPAAPQLFWYFDVVAVCFYSTSTGAGSFPATIDQLHIKGASIR